MYTFDGIAHGAKEEEPMMAIRQIQAGWSETQNKVNQRIRLKQKLGSEFVSNDKYFTINFIEDEKDRKLMLAYSRCRKKGDVKRLIERFQIDSNVLIRTRQKYNVPTYEVEGSKKLDAKIIKLYKTNRLSITRIGEKIGMNAETVRRRLLKNNIQMREQNSNDLRFYRTQNEMDPEQLAGEILERYTVHKQTIKQISIDLKIDQRSISVKLQAQGVEIKRRRSATCQKFTCWWCAEEHDAWTTGKRAQRYCGISCKSKCKDLKRGKRTPAGLEKLKQQLKDNWGDKYQEQYNKIMNNGK